MLMSAFRGGGGNLTRTKGSVEEFGVYHVTAAGLSRSNQMNNQDKRRRLARNQLLVTFSKQQSNPYAVSVVSGREPSSVTPSLAHKFTRLPTWMAEPWASAPKWGSLGPAVIKAHRFDPVWAQSGWDDGKKEMERDIQTFHSLIKCRTFIYSVLRVCQKSTLCKANQGWNCLKQKWGDQYSVIRWSSSLIAP